MELRDYLKVVRRRWRVILVSLIVVVALASLVTLRTTPQYESKARLFVSSTERSTVIFARLVRARVIRFLNCS